jgi:hypothetical protein
MVRRPSKARAVGDKSRQRSCRRVPSLLTTAMGVITSAINPLACTAGNLKRAFHDANAKTVKHPVQRYR